MSISANVLSIGSPQSQVHQPSVHEQRITLRNMQPVTDPQEYARDGYVFVANRLFTLANNASTALAMRTGPYGAQFQFYEIDADNSTIYAQLIEGATYGTVGTVLAYNLNRDVSDSYDSVLTGADNVTGGTVISAEFVPASNQGGGQFSALKVHTLEPSTAYVMKFTDRGGTGTELHFQLGFAEQYDNDHDIWVNFGTAAVDNGFRLKPQESIQFDVSPLDSLVAYSNQPTKLNVLRQVVE
jgi:hypothetical protein